MEGKGEQLLQVSHRCKKCLNEGDWDDLVKNHPDSTGKKGNYILLIARVKVSDLGWGAQVWVLAKREIREWYRRLTLQDLEDDQGCPRHTGESCCGCSASEKAVGSSPTSTRPNCIDTLKQTGTQNPTLFWPRSGVRKAREPTKEQVTANRIILWCLILLINVIEWRDAQRIQEANIWVCLWWNYRDNQILRALMKLVWLISVRNMMMLLGGGGSRSVGVCLWC